MVHVPQVVKAVFQRTRSTDLHTGWGLATKEGEEPGGVAPDPVNGVRFIRDLYDLAGATAGRFSVPVSKATSLALALHSLAAKEHFLDLPFDQALSASLGARSRSLAPLHACFCCSAATPLVLRHCQCLCPVVSLLSVLFDEEAQTVLGRCQHTSPVIARETCWHNRGGPTGFPTEPSLSVVVADTEG